MRQEIEQAFAEVCKELFKTDVSVELTRPDEQFGDYATNVALQLGKQLSKKPREVAEAIKAKLQHAAIAQVEIAGPGFLNITLTDAALVELAQQKPAQTLAGQTVVTDYSDPNPFKVLHAGHLYTTITGDAIAKLIEAAGATVHRLNYGGDVGLHVGKAMWSILQFLGGEHPEKLEAVDLGQRLEWLSARYVEGNTAYEDDEQAKTEIVEVNKRVYQVHADSDQQSPFAQIYWTCWHWSYDGFDRFYEQLQVNKFEKYVPESTVTQLGIDLVQKGLNQGVFEYSDGAVVFQGEPYGLHTRVFMNSKGLPTYEAKELGLAATKWQEYHFDLSVVITANDIVEYMKVVLKALESFYPEGVKRTKHFTHGVIKLPGALKMSSRKGNILRAQDILDAAHTANKTLTGNDNQQTVLAAVKYAFLKQRIGGDIIYDPAESVALEGNSGPYLQYAHARACSILAKANIVDSELLEVDSFDAGERSLLRKIGEYSEVADRAVQELMPHHICTYLYELAQSFNHFYEHSRVMGDPREAIRLQLVKAYANTLKNGLELLNIQAPDRM